MYRCTSCDLTIFLTSDDADLNVLALSVMTTAGKPLQLVNRQKAKGKRYWSNLL